MLLKVRYSIVKPFLIVSLLLFGGSALTFGDTNPSGPGNRTILATSQDAWNQAQITNLHSILQVSFATNLFRRETDLFSEVMNQLPETLPEAKLTSLLWGVRVPLLNLNTLSLSEAKDLAKTFASLTPAELEKYHLLTPTLVFDPTKPLHIDTALSADGKKYRFILRPDPAFVDWVTRFRGMIHDKLPALYAQHFEGGEARSGIGIPILDWTDQQGDPLPVENMEAARQKVENLFQAAEIHVVGINRGKEKTNIEPVRFDWSRQPIDLVTPPDKGDAPPTPLFTFKANPTTHTVEPSEVSRWIAEGLDTPGELEGVDERFAATAKRSVVEMDTSKLLSGSTTPYRDYLDDPSVISESWLPSKKEFKTMGRGAFLRQIPEALRPAYEREWAKLKAGTLPAPVRTSKEVGKSEITLFVANKSHPKLAEEKGLSLVPLAKRLMLPPDKGISSGIMLYGSSTRAEHLNPSDSDLILNSLVHVPDSVSSYEEARKYAEQSFVKNILGHYVELAKAGAISFSELRLGSDKTMGHQEEAGGGPFTSYESNPYLSQEDILRGYYTDPKTQKHWSLEDLTSLGDFSKAKFELYSKGPDGKNTRQEVSLQFLTGFDWKGQTYFIRKNGLKGAPSSLLTTGIYYGAESYGTAAVLSRTVDFYVSQRGPMLARAIGELLQTGYEHSPPNLLSDPVWKTKYIKNFYSYLVLLKRSGLRLDEIFFEQTKKFMEANGTWDESMTFPKFVDEILKTFNKPESRIIGRIKRVANDFAEFHERNQTMLPAQLQVRLQELMGPEGSFAQFDHLLKERKVTLPGTTLDTLHRFEDACERLEKAQGSSKAVLLKEIGDSGIFEKSENALLDVDVHFNLDPGASAHLSKPVRDIVRTMTALSPHMYSDYLESRLQTSDADLKLTYELMGIRGSPENIATMQKLNRLLEQGKTKELSQAQRSLFWAEEPIAVCEQNGLRALVDEGISKEKVAP